MSNKIITAYIFGNSATWNDIKKEWIFEKTGRISTIEEYYNLTCPKCKKKPTEDGHDPCIENLPGVKFACCGHGVDDGYIWFENGIMISGKFKTEHKFGKE